MIAVVVSLVAVVLLVIAVVALGMRSMSRRESSLPPERLKQMIEKEEQTHARSTDEFAAHEPRMANFSPDFSPIDEVKPKPVRTGQRGKRGVDEWGNPTNDEDDEEFWATIRSDATEGGFGAGGTVAARKGAARPVERDEREPAAPRPAEREPERPAAARPAGRERTGERKRPSRREAAAVDPDATTVQAPLPQRPQRSRREPAAPVPAPTAALADLVEPAQPRPAPSASDLADQRTVTFSAPPADVMSILGAGAKPVPANRPDPRPSGSLSTNGAPATSGSFPAVGAPGSLSSNGVATGPMPATGPVTGSFAAAGGAFNPAGSGSFPATPVAPIHGAPTSDPFPAAYNGADALDAGWPAAGPATPSASGSWPSHDILDDSPAPAPAPVPGPSGSWPGFQPQQPSGSYPASYEVRSGWAVADDSDPLTAPSPATGVPTAPARAVSPRDDVLSAPPVPQSIAYETGDFASAAGQPGGPDWPESPSTGGTGGWPTYNEMYGKSEGQRPGQSGGGRGRRRATPEPDFPDYYR
ncbi:hypothetical protein [Nonomuraea montanisoli]|uniref:hypothetical protein n=1 Tax=Nonomuraea montanisoli TaxID=2741721 RepID=UPI0019667732|nr:hypothetical protein [Nonomuraea montanisoli]